MENGRPYKETMLKRNVYFRVFDSSLDPKELVWHRDNEDRDILCLEGNGWFLQKDNQLPVEMIPGKTYCIERNEWHRVIPHQSKLKLIIIKQNNQNTI
jgi:quercetin dioxygenase-like cupin family protein